MDEDDAIQLALAQPAKSGDNTTAASFVGHGPLSPGAAIPTLFLSTVTLGFRPFGLGLACVYIVGIAAPNPFIASLLSSTSVTQKNVQTVIEHTTTLVSEIVEDITKDMLNSLKLHNTNMSAEDYTSLQCKLKQNSKNLFSYWKQVTKSVLIKIKIKILYEIVTFI